MPKRSSRPKGPRTIRVFIASPGDLAVERRAFKDVVDDLNTGFGDGAKVTFEPLGWEDTLATTGQRSQSVINLEVDRADVFVLAMHRRWGQEAPDAKLYSSYTEEEFHRAYDRWKKTGAPEIFVFFKYIDPGQMADPGEQLKKVLAFRKELENSRHVLYRGFSDEAGFKQEIDKHLRAYVRGDLPKTDIARDAVLLPLEVVEEVKKARAAAEEAEQRAKREHQAAEEARQRAERFALEFAERAAKAALEGRVEEARQDFAKATDGTTNMRVLSLASEFYYRTGDLATTEEMLERSLAISGRDAEVADTATALGKLGWVYRARGDLDRAEEMHRKALDIDERLGRQEGIANQYSSLGVIYETRGELDRAEEMHWMTLAIDEKRGNQEGMASEYGNLGLVYQARGDLDRAEEMLRKALVIDERLGRQEGMARAYGSLGLIYRARGDLDRAEEMHRKALAIDERLGRQEGVANQYGNLGLIYETRGDLDRAEEMHRKALAINERLGRQEGMANQYGNLGSVAESRGDRSRARELWTQARDLFAKIGMPHGVKKQQQALDACLPLSGTDAEVSSEKDEGQGRAP